MEAWYTDLVECLRDDSLVARVDPTLATTLRGDARRERVRRAQDAILDLLADGPLTPSELRTRVEQRSRVSFSTYRRARYLLVKSGAIAFAHGAWSLAKKPSAVTSGLRRSRSATPSARWSGAFD